jgi:hypothetical protein
VSRNRRSVRSSDEIDLTVKDFAAGFDREAAKDEPRAWPHQHGGAAEAVDGTMTSESQPNRGTTIHDLMPLSSRGDSMRAAG